MLGLASANPVVFPVVALLAVFEWGYKINERSEDEPVTAGAILLAAFAWICMVVGACVSEATIAGVLLGVGATGLLSLLVRVWRREGPLLALETVACATIQAALYSTFVALIVVGFAADSAKNWES